jgi:PilZ domain
MTTYSNPADRRAFGRRPTNQHAMAHIVGRAPLRCAVRDISEGGALLEFGEPVLLRNRLRLVWEGTGQQAECEVRHVQGAKAGVQFICPNGPRIARESIAAGAAKLDDVSMPPLAPAPAREETGHAAGLLVNKFRQARRPAGAAEVQLPVTQLPVTEVLAASSVPLPMPASAYASAASL